MTDGGWFFFAVPRAQLPSIDTDRPISANVRQIRSHQCTETVLRPELRGPRLLRGLIVWVI